MSITLRKCIIHCSTGKFQHQRFHSKCFLHIKVSLKRSILELLTFCDLNFITCCLGSTSECSLA